MEKLRIVKQQNKTIHNYIEKRRNRHKYGEINWFVKNKDLYKEFRTATEAEEWGMEIYQNWANKYKEVMKLAKKIELDRMFTAPIECYCGYTYREINNFLRNEVDIESNRYREMADILSIVLCSAPRIPINLILYRLVSDEFISELIRLNKQDSPIPIQEKGFISTSLIKDIVNENEAYASERNLLKIYVESDTVGIYVNAIARRSEQEMLLIPNMYLALVEYPYIDQLIGKTVFECKLEKFY